jgi:hypothetical protein
MNKSLSNPLGDADLQVFTETAISDPAELAALGKTSGRPHRLPCWLKWALGAAALVVALAAGALLGHFLR